VANLGVYRSQGFNGIVNKQGQILCSKRSEQLSQRPGVWQSNFGGHVNFDQSFEANAVRELAEESGIKMTEHDFFYLGETKNLEYKHIARVYCCLFDGDIKNLSFFDGEITEVKWMNMEEAWNEKLHNPEKWATGCPPERKKQIKEWLKV